MTGGVAPEHAGCDTISADNVYRLPPVYLAAVAITYSAENIGCTTS